jgi:hypothetical protein
MPSLSFSNKRKGAPIWLSFSFCPFRKTTHLKVASIELATSKKGGFIYSVLFLWEPFASNFYIFYKRPPPPTQERGGG